MEKFRVTFYPDKKSIEVDKNTTILSAAISADIYIASHCGGDGVCGRCKVILKKGKVLAQPTGILTLKEKKHGLHLACLSAVQSDLEVEIPQESRVDLDKPILRDKEIRLKGPYLESAEIEPPRSVLEDKIFRHSPLATKLYLELPPPNLEDKVSDLERLYRQIRRIQNIPLLQTGLVNIRQLPELLRDCDWKVTVTLGKRNGATEIVLVEPADTSAKNFGLCFDIGTTTLTGELVDLNHKQVLGTRIAYNKQVSFGSDVITRIIYAEQEDGLERLHLALVDGMNQMTHELIAEHQLNLNDLTCVVCSGNTTMIHLLLKIGPTYLRKDPYIPSANFLPVLRAAEAGVKINPRGLLFCVPGVASYVGGDVTAGVLSCGLDKEEGLSMLIDVGTNGEVVLGNRDFLISAAASAGPAFEGSGVTCGMRASSGAIQKVKISPADFAPCFEVIGGLKPQGICGSGYIDIIAEMLRAGLLDKNGKIKAVKNPRIRQGESGKEFVIAFKKEAGIASDIVISEADIENLKRAKAAIYSAMATLVKQMKLNFSLVKKIFIAGGFGTYLDIENAITLGLLPDLERQRFIFVGNSSLSGSRQILLSSEAIKKAEEIAGKITYFELSTDSGYMDEYMAALFFPHTDLLEFPSLKNL